MRQDMVFDRLDVLSIIVPLHRGHFTTRTGNKAQSFGTHREWRDSQREVGVMSRAE